MREALETLAWVLLALWFLASLGWLAEKLWQILKACWWLLTKFGW